VYAVLPLACPEKMDTKSSKIIKHESSRTFTHNHKPLPLFTGKAGAILKNDGDYNGPRYT